MNDSCENEYIVNKKRRRSNSYNKKIIQSEIPQKKQCSAESKKVTELNLKEIKYFIAKLEPKYENLTFKSEEKITGEDLIFYKRRIKAEKIINDLKNKQDELKSIEEALKYNNTSKTCIYKLLNYYYKKNDEKNFRDKLNLYKFCITKKFAIKEGEKVVDVDLEKLYKINLLIEEYEELPNSQINDDNTIKDVRNSLVEFFTSYYYVAKYVTEYKSKLTKEELKYILTIKYGKCSDNSYMLNYDYEEKLKLLGIKKKKNNNGKMLLESIENYLGKYLYYQDFNGFQVNQPIDFSLNLTLYYNYIIWSLYEITIELDTSEQKICFKEDKLYAYEKLKDFHDLIFDKYFDQNETFDNTMNKMLQFFINVLSCPRAEDIDYVYDYINLKKIKSFIDESSAETFLKNINKKYKSLNAKFKDKKDKKDIIVFKETNDIKSRKIEINCLNYSNYGLTSDLPNNINWLWKNKDFSTFQDSNFFLKEDIDYLEFLIKHILSSTLFKQIFATFNNVTNVVDYYFNEPDNINEYIRRIIFLPFKKNDLGKFASTDRRLLSVIVSGFPESDIHNIKEYRIYRLIESALKVIVLAVHEPGHYIKGCYSMITNGVVQRNTSNNKDIESGFFIEEVLFGWVCDKNNPINLIENKLLKENIVCGNIALLNKKIDLITAIKLLDPDIYNHDLEYFRKSLFYLKQSDLETFSFSANTNKKYKEYVESVLQCDSINGLFKSNFSISAAMGSYDYSIDYIRFNHNTERFKDDE